MGNEVAVRTAYSARRPHSILSLADRLSDAGEALGVDSPGVLSVPLRLGERPMPEAALQRFAVTWNCNATAPSRFTEASP